MTPLAAAITHALLHSIWQDAFVAVGLGAALIRLRGSSAQARYAAACAALVIMTLLPVATGVVAYERTRVDGIASGSQAAATVDAPARTDAARTFERAARTLEEAAGIFGDAARTFTVRELAAWLARAQSWALPLWLLGVALCSLRLVASGVHASALRRAASPADDNMRQTVARVAAVMGIARRVGVIVPPHGGGAATLGWLRPVILLPPAAAIGLTPQQFEALIVHELAHIRRYDYLVNAAQMVVETVFFYHPAIWWASHRVRVERELCCDDEAVRWSGDAHGYARALAAIARWTPGPALAAAGGPLVHRIERLLGLAPERRAAPARGSLAAGALAIALVVAAAGWMHAQQPQRTTSNGATLSGTVYDPLDSPADHTPIALTGGNDFVQESTTDGAGHFRFENLSPGRYTFTTPITDAFVPALTLGAGEDRKIDVRLRVEEVVVDVDICDGCRQVGAIRAPLAAAAPGIPNNPLIVQAEPVEGWDAFNAAQREYPALLKANGVDGTVVVDGRITADGVVEHPQGRVTDLAFHRRPTFSCQPNTVCRDQLSAAAVALVQQQRWRPATVRGTPLEVPLHVTVEYTLAGK